jgi:hypothetical protein
MNCVSARLIDMSIRRRCRYCLLPVIGLGPCRILGIIVLKMGKNRRHLDPCHHNADILVATPHCSPRMKDTRLLTKTKSSDGPDRHFPRLQREKPRYGIILASTSSRAM